MRSIQKKLEGLIQAANRYPLTMIFLLAIAVVNIISINNEMEDHSKFLFMFIVGALLSIVGQQLFERFFTRLSNRLLLMGGAVLLAVGYYFTIQSDSVFSMVSGIKTTVMIFALVMAFIWAPTIKNKVTFNESFMSTFKAFFITVLFTGVIAAGISAIIFAIDSLLFTVNNKAIPHALNIIISIFAPIFFLSFTPPYPGKGDTGRSAEELAKREAIVQKAISCPKNLNVLISYIIIPLSAVYTVILLVYVLLNIRGDFWTKNLLEPLLVSYAVTVILVYILASNIENKFASYFRKIFPKVLLPIVFFQTIASALKIQDAGITHGRYYVILFGVFAIIAGLIFSFLPVRKNGMIATVLILFSAISIIPPVDAFTVSRVNQTALLKEVLVENNMLEENTIVPNANVSKEDKMMITRTVSYLDSMGYSTEIEWLPDKIYYYGNFKKTFGFEEVYEQRDGVDSQFAYLEWEKNPVVPIEGYDLMIHMYTNSAESSKVKEIPLEKDGKSYTLEQKRDGDFFILSVIDEEGTALIQFNTKEITDKILYENEQSLDNKGDMLTVEDATLTQENDQVKLSVLANSVDAYDGQYSADFYLFLQIK